MSSPSRAWARRLVLLLAGERPAADLPSSSGEPFLPRVGFRTLVLSYPKPSLGSWEWWDIGSAARQTDRWLRWFPIGGVLSPLAGQPEDEILKDATHVASRKTVFDISTGRRDFLEVDEACEVLSPLAEHGNSYTKICFSNRSFGVDAARVTEPIMKSLSKQLIEVDISDFIAGRPKDDALEVMRIFSSSLENCDLKYLNLSDNVMGEKGVREFEALLA